MKLGIDALSNIMKTNEFVEAVASRGTIEILLRTLTVQDWNGDIALKVTRMLLEMTVLEDNIERMVQQKAPEVLTNINKTRQRHG